MSVVVSTASAKAMVASTNAVLMSIPSSAVASPSLASSTVMVLPVPAANLSDVDIEELVRLLKRTKARGIHVV